MRLANVLSGERAPVGFSGERLGSKSLGVAGRDGGGDDGDDPAGSTEVAASSTEMWGALY
jgi:hypothetical protein